MKKTSEVTVSSGNVFEDLEVAAPEEALAKAELIARVAELIASKVRVHGAGSSEGAERLLSAA